MRWPLGLVVLVACSPPSGGAIFWIKGGPQFDQVELFFGATQVDNAQFATPLYGPQLGVVFERDYAEDDVITLDAPATEHKYLVPYSPDLKLGTYVGIVVRIKDPNRSDLFKDVAVGEVFDFKVPSDRVYQYEVNLATSQLVDTWSDPGCFFWKHPRPDRGLPERLAVVQHGNYDCDEYAPPDDCDALCSGDCGVNRGCAALGTCAIGCSMNGLCAAQTCLPPEMCSPACIALPTLHGQFECASAVIASHLEYDVNITGAGLCTREIPIDLTELCRNPRVLASAPADGWQFTGVETAGACRLMMSASTTTAYTTKHHILLAYDSPYGGPAHTVIVGISPKPQGSGTCDPVGYMNTLNTGQTYRCVMP